MSPDPFKRHGSSAHPVPMAIPNLRHEPPPPLPPPTHIPELSLGQDPGWQWGNTLNHNDFGPPAHVRPGSSLLGGFQRPRDDLDHIDPLSAPTTNGYPLHDRATPFMSEAYGEIDAPAPRSEFVPSLQFHPPTILLTSPRLTGERDLRQRAIEQSSQSYDKQLLNRIGGPNTPKRQSIPYSPTALQENGANNSELRSGSIWSIKVPERRHLSADSASTCRWPPGAVSPRSTSPWMEQEGFDSSRSTSRRNRSLNFDYAASQRGSYDLSMFPHDMPQSEDGQMRSLNIHDSSLDSPKAGCKRRASSPPRERGDRASLSSNQELPHRNSLQAMSSRTSPSSRLHPNHSSLSSVSSAGPRHGSMGSSLGVASMASSATSFGSGGFSSCLPSPTQEIEIGSGLTVNHGLSPNKYGARHQRTASENAAGIANKPPIETAHHSRAASLSNTQGVYVCTCCPKKPAKFETQEDLRYHESEKQYTCAYHDCTKRFKNKNEAERHQNSVHLRRQSWCCAALSGVEAAFHASSSTAYSADVCGYCGQEFSNPPQWDRRAEHLTHAHKFGECNQSKKFYRADHFRQHLKHTHHGTSGKWTNVLENACVKYESHIDGADRRVSSLSVSAPAATAAQPVPPPALMVTTTGLGSGPSPPPAPDALHETPHDS